MDMENFRLRVFRAVAHHLNFRAAAEELLLTQPAITQQIKALEEELSTSLFDRAGGHVSLMPAGLALLPFALEMKRLSEDAAQAVAAAAGSIAGQLSIGASQTIGQYLLPRFIADFLREHPAVEINITGGNTRKVIEELRARRVHIALIEGPALGNDVRVKPFMEDHMVCVVPAGHEWAGREITVADLRRATLLTREPGSGSRKIVERELERAGLPVREWKMGMTFDSTEGLLSAVEAGLGTALVSRWAVRNQLALGTLKLARVRGLALKRMFSIATAAGPEPVGTTGVFYRFVLERANQLALRSTGRVAPRKTG
jgi:DNA-binding transcriptional LysR family regulator